MEWNYIGDTYRKRRKKSFLREVRNFLENFQGKEITFKEIKEALKVDFRLNSNHYKGVKEIAKELGYSIGYRQLGRGRPSLLFIKERGKVLKEEEWKELVGKEWEVIVCPYCGKKIYKQRE